MSAAQQSPQRGEVWQRFGAPTEQIGSVNDPRSRQEFGVEWNEKWIYPAAGGHGPQRVVLWHRYDLVGVFRVAADGRAEREEVDFA